MKPAAPLTEFSLWRNEHLFNIDFASYTLSHHSFPRHFHDHYVIEWVVEGMDGFYCDGKNYVAENNQLVLINPGEVHTGNTVSDTPLHYFSFYPDKKALQQVATALHISLSNDFYFQHSLLDQPLLTSKLSLLFDSFKSGTDIMQQQEIFLDCMQDLLRSDCDKNEIIITTDRKDKRVQLLIDHIRAHFKENISLRQLADMVCLNPFHLVRLFKKVTGLSPYDYLLILRTEHARQLLRKGHRVQDAASDAGFYDASHLNRVFYKTNATSPKSFRSSKSQYCTNFTA